VNDSAPRKTALAEAGWMTLALLSGERELSKLQLGLSAERRLYIGHRLLGSVHAGTPSARAPRQSASSLLPGSATADRVEGPPLGGTSAPANPTAFDPALVNARDNRDAKSYIGTRNEYGVVNRNVGVREASTLAANTPSPSTHAPRNISNLTVSRNLPPISGRPDAAAPRRVTLTMGRRMETIFRPPALEPHTSSGTARTSIGDNSWPSLQAGSSGGAALIASTVRVASPPGSRVTTGGSGQSSSAETAAPALPQDANRSFAPVGTSRSGTIQMAPGVAGMQMPFGEAFANSGTAPPGSGLAPQGQTGTNDSSAPSAAGPTEGDIYLDGTLMGRWVTRALTQAASRQPSGSAAFDSTRNRLPVGAMIGV